MQTKGLDFSLFLSPSFTPSASLHASRKKRIHEWNLWGFHKMIDGSRDERIASGMVNWAAKGKKKSINCNAYGHTSSTVDVVDWHCCWKGFHFHVFDWRTLDERPHGSTDNNRAGQSKAIIIKMFNYFKMTFDWATIWQHIRFDSNRFEFTPDYN